MITRHYPNYPPLFAPRDLVRGTLAVIAPHPDDEVIGPGGLVIAHRDAGVEVHSIIVTDGLLGDADGTGGENYTSLRRSESEAASALLGGTTLRFLGFPDGGVRGALAKQSDGPVERLRALLEAIRPATIVFPSPFEIHPDHRATAIATLEAVATCGEARLLAYEVGAMMPCNLLIDITGIFPRKDAALRRFASQYRFHDLSMKMGALDRARTVNCDDPAVTHCEAYLRISHAERENFLSAVDGVLEMTDRMAPGIPYG